MRPSTSSSASFILASTPRTQAPMLRLATVIPTKPQYPFALSSPVESPTFARALHNSKAISASKTPIKTMNDDSSELAATNSRVLGVSMPEITLPSGEKVQTGTVGALLVSVKAYDAALAQQQVDERSRNANVQQIAEQIKVAVPLLLKVGMFDLFTPDEWVAGSSPGRRLVGEEAKRLLYTQARS